MEHVSGLSRQQLQISSLEDKIALDNPSAFYWSFSNQNRLDVTEQKKRILNPLDPDYYLDIQTA